MKIRSIILLLLCLSCTGLTADEGIYGRPVRKVTIPNIPGYVTLMGDFHMHSIYSDGSVLPVVRVNEIYREGLNAMAITDHAEFLPIILELPKNSNRANELASARAREINIVYANGTEITRDFGQDDLSAHFVCLFVNDVNRIEVPDTIDMLREAKKQGAFIFWAHPWVADKKVWEENIPAIIKEGLLDGVEIMNQGWQSDEAFVWAMKNNLTILGNTDAHDPVFYGRPTTLIFAREKNAESMREALFSGRTAVLNGASLYGREKYLSAMFFESVKVKSVNIQVTAAAPGKLIFSNNSDINYRIIIDKTYLPINLRKEIIIEANKDTFINITNKTLSAGTSQVKLKFENANMHTENGKSPVMEMILTVTVK